MAIFWLYNLVNSLNASYEMLSEYYTEEYYSLFKSFVLNNNTIDIVCIIQNKYIQWTIYIISPTFYV